MLLLDTPIVNIGYVLGVASDWLIKTVCSRDYGNVETHIWIRASRALVILSV